MELAPFDQPLEHAPFDQPLEDHEPLEPAWLEHQALEGENAQFEQALEPPQDPLENPEPFQPREEPLDAPHEPSGPSSTS